jgi:hypothetical protein
MTRIFFQVFFLVALHDVAAAFQSCPPIPSSKAIINSRYSTKLFAKSKRKGNTQKEDNTNRSGWDTLKRVFYGSVDLVSDLSSKLSSQDDQASLRITDGYSSLEQSVKKAETPARRLVEEYEARAVELGVGKEKAMGSSTKTKPRTSFDAFKERLYSASDTFGAVPVEPQTPLMKLGRSIPYKKSLAQELGGIDRVEDLLSEDAVKRFQAQKEIREREARLRAEARNEKIRAKKEDLYRVVDAMQAAVDSFPESIEKTEKVLKESIDVVKEIPTKVSKVVEEVKAIPTTVKMKADETKKVVAESIDRTTRVVEEVIDVPQKIKEKVQDTQKTFTVTQDTMNEGVTDMKVTLGLEKPKPKPPKTPPPEEETLNDLALKATSNVAAGVGKAAWWATKSVASAAWNGAQSAIQDREKPGPSPPVQPKPQIKSSPKSSTLDAQTAELQKEVEEALRLAEETLRKVDLDT